ncbi:MULTISPECIES: 6-hydroxymethylpterin diphosphokinase MptE-like protein [unclassified Clostridium]|uniref:motility associated factor glycosyltransferase family protein n=1 Tax=unclassified Clostridium TaxID=2614128 RepID=UPI0002972CCE|nr:MULTISPECIES: 6-hydroxymethylpterin diphosphokinase MptE-like protein [unclassified Clostridium]EKQ51097.1 MAG: hypothetical protein A370_05124 [Clostridium sp. Maddingley MBC34-26]
MFQLEKSKCGAITLTYKNKYIHSKYDPSKEGEQFAKGNIELINKQISVLYGLGLGYHIYEIGKIISENSVLYVFEYNEELINYCKEINPQIFHYENIKIIEGSNKDFYSLLSKCLNKVEDIMIHRASLETIEESNANLFNLINDFNRTKQLSRIDDTYKILGEENEKENFLKNYPHISELLKELKLCEKPFLIVSAGPSLDFDLDLLEEHQNKFIIICVGSSLRALMNKNIRPNVIVIIDSKEIVQKQFEGYENENIPLCFPASASKWAINFYNGPKYIFEKEKGNSYIEVVGTVAVSAIDIAIKSDANTVVLLGQDLAYLKDRSHTKVYEEVYGFKDSEKLGNKIKTVLGVNGEILETSPGYLTFKHKIEQLISRNNHIEFINCSRGAMIEGTLSLGFKDYFMNFNC